ncbi:MAG: HAD-IC family P-type ATPase, partial [Lachnospiraceae bacterium]|nr:HAD-IC family P-type ATPase [Lachnospiraceae bacterium]
YSLGGTALAYLLTRNVNRALSLLMVDFSCALKLSMPLAVLSAMREAGRHHITVKGGKFMEAIAEADTIVFDKTGTLTRACPTVVGVEAFNGTDKDEMLRTAACLEEHYPHSIANAVTRRAIELGLKHDEMHEELEYVVAHGISGRIGDTKVVIGSYHFVFEDEGCTVPEGEKERFDSLPLQYSHLYMAMGGVLSAVILIADPLREEAKEVIEELHELGIKNCVMMTGDSERTAGAIAEEVGVDEYHAEVLPEDKAEFIRQKKAEGHKVIMTGDGINDSPALSEADCGIAISDGAAIAREIADVTIAAEDLRELVKLRRLSTLLMKRINSNYRFVMGFNGGLMALGFFGVLQPTVTALLHNTSTIGISIKSMTDLDS